jgi:hypothetical protein
MAHLGKESVLPLGHAKAETTFIIVLLFLMCTSSVHKVFHLIAAVSPWKLRQNFGSDHHSRLLKAVSDVAEQEDASSGPQASSSCVPAKVYDCPFCAFHFLPSDLGSHSICLRLMVDLASFKERGIDKFKLEVLKLGSEFSNL